MAYNVSFTTGVKVSDVSQMINREAAYMMYGEDHCKAFTAQPKNTR